MCASSIKVWRAHFPPLLKTSIAQTCELNRNRTEARCLIAFDTSAAAVDFPFVEQAARLTRCIDSQRNPTKGIETEFLLSSVPAAKLDAQQMLRSDRDYWGIETGFHLRLDVIAGEDRSRVRNRSSTLNLGMIRRAAVSIAVHWIRKCPNPRQATMSGFFDSMDAKESRKAFSLVTTCHPSWLPQS
jgi:predicted transposase YbfD/YdcC